MRSGTMRAFTGVQASFYWSSTTDRYYPEWAYGRVLIDGTFYIELKTYRRYVWPVRRKQ
ncbi:MAG: DUF1566 domain-containing protein [Gammaproteobacteria bacterium]|nr:DUF1566 domain-containing protein [Gammaproteobacteria bacterium]